MSDWPRVQASMIIDAHQHVWDIDRAEYPWLIPQLAPIDRTVDLDEILPTMREFDIGGTILVQAADNAGDTANMIRVADAHPEVVGIVAWVPLDQPDKVAEALGGFAGDRRIVGIRTLLHERPDIDWVFRSDVTVGLELVANAGLAFDFVSGGVAALQQVPELSERHPTLPIVIDHLGRPPISGTDGERAEWRRLLRAAAQNPLVSAKLSGLYATEGPLDGWTIDGIRPAILDALDILGPDRIMFGGDWPISVLAGGYARTWRATNGILGELDASAREAILGGTATAVYSLDHDLLAAASAARKGTK